MGIASRIKKHFTKTIKGHPIPNDVSSTSHEELIPRPLSLSPICQQKRSPYIHQAMFQPIETSTPDNTLDYEDECFEITRSLSPRLTLTPLGRLDSLDSLSDSVSHISEFTIYEERMKDNYSESTTADYALDKIADTSNFTRHGAFRRAVKISTADIGFIEEETIVENPEIGHIDEEQYRCHKCRKVIIKKVVFV